MKEKNFQSRFSKWLKYRYQGTACFELKITKTSSIPFNDVKEHQLNALLNAKHNHIEFKIPDDSIGQKPFDCFRLEKVPSYVVIQYYRHGQDEFIMIDIDDFIKEIEISPRKSLTEDRAKEIGTVYLLED